ncbi:hypothetical protein Q31b_44520 [Novipirellula aureliae]|uniref:Uncharacterized protein n=1 Tax=Novipirellula aureliae TaxID=2527966 RepID=A0A5C6DNA9_9BACT|nr:hypothetical protein Q31b_44520 [Novipirellula aureliae]
MDDSLIGTVAVSSLTDARIEDLADRAVEDDGFAKRRGEEGGSGWIRGGGGAATNLTNRHEWLRGWLSRFGGGEIGGEGGSGWIARLKGAGGRPRISPIDTNGCGDGCRVFLGGGDRGGGWLRVDRASEGVGEGAATNLTNRLKWGQRGGSSLSQL